MNVVPEERGSVTINDVASAAGVSTATVSRAFADPDKVSASLRDRVYAVAGRLSYSPNTHARSLARGRSQTVGVVVPNLANPYFAEVLKGVAEEASSVSYRMLVADSNEDRDSEVPLAHGLLREVDGLILCAPRMNRRKLGALATEARYVVTINQASRGGANTAVNVNAYAGMVAIGRHLTGLGHRSLVYLSGPEESWQNRERWRGVRSVAGGEVSVRQVSAGGTIDEGYAAAETALATGATGLLAFDDLAALGVLARLRELRVRVPDDVSLTGFDDIPFASYSDPGLTTVRSPQRELGRAAWRALQRMLEGGEPPSAPAVLAADLVVRKSTGPPKHSAGSLGETD